MHIESQYYFNEICAILTNTVWSLRLPVIILLLRRLNAYAKYLAKKQRTKQRRNILRSINATFRSKKKQRTIFSVR